jgi:signal transduction histidine kinase
MFSAARWRLTFVFTAVLVLILGISGVVVYLTTESLIYDQVDAELAAKAQSDMFLVEDHESRGPGPGPSDEGGGQATDSQEFEQGGYFFAVVDESGEVIEKSGNCDLEALAPRETIQQAVDNGDATIETQSPDGDTQRVYLLSATTREGQEVVLQMGRSIEAELETLSRLRNILLAVVAVSILPALFGGYLLSGRALRPIKVAMDGQRAFIADASHELRTPVAVVRTNAELLERHIETGKIGQTDSDTTAVQDIIAETDRLGRMVTQMLTLAQADAGQTVLTESDVALDELAEEVGRSMRSLAEAKGLTMDVRAAPNTWVHGDRERLREVLVTLLDNAIKYTETGAVSVTVERSHRRATVVVSDTGPGIAPDDLAHIFERFYRVDRARSRDEGGTGLGLAIARHIVEAHDGTIRIESEPGKGTLVKVELRTLAHEPAAQPDHLPEPGA